MRWIVCLMLVTIWISSLFTGFALPYHPHTPLIGIAALVLLPRSRPRGVAPADPAKPALAIGH